MSRTGNESNDSVQFRIAKIANGFLFRPGGPAIYCNDANSLVSIVSRWLIDVTIPSLDQEVAPDEQAEITKLMAENRRLLEVLKRASPALHLQETLRR